MFFKDLHEDKGCPYIVMKRASDIHIVKNYHNIHVTDYMDFILLRGAGLAQQLLNTDKNLFIWVYLGSKKTLVRGVINIIFIGYITN